MSHREIVSAWHEEQDRSHVRQTPPAPVVHRRAAVSALTEREMASLGGGGLLWPLAELDASKSELAIETLEIPHEGLRAQRR